MTYRPPRHLYPFESHWLDLDGIRMHYLDEGPRDAHPVLMVHGNPTWSFYYRNLVRALGDRYRCIVPDHVGCGLSDKPGDEAYPYVLERRIEDFTRLVETVAPKGPVSLVVHDWGGMIGMAWAVRHAERVSDLVILNTGAFPKPPGKRLPLALWLAGRTPVGTLLVRGLNAFAAGAARVGFKAPVSDEVRAAYTGPYDSWRNRIATLRFVQDIPLRPGDRGHDILVETGAAIPRLADRPCLVGWGERDFVFDRHFLETWLEFLPGAEVHRYPAAGHYVLEDAGEELVGAIARFLDRRHAALEPA